MKKHYTKPLTKRERLSVVTALGNGSFTIGEPPSTDG